MSDGRLRTGSLRARTIVAVLVLLAVLLGALAVTVEALLGARLRAQIEERLQDRASAAVALIGTVDPNELAERLSAQGLAVKIENAAGEQIVAGPSPDQLRAGPPAGLDGPGPAPSGVSRDANDAAGDAGAEGDADAGGAVSAAPSVTASAFSGDDALVTLTTTLSDDSILTLTASAASVSQTLVQLRWVMVGASVGLLVVATAGVVLVVRTTLRPLDRVTEVARSIAGGDRGRRLRPSSSRTEIGRVATAFDEMLDDIEGAERSALQAESRLRTFVSDAAHELRTPVAGIRAAAETLVRAELSDEQREQFAAIVAGEAGRATRLIDDMLMMARLDRGIDLDLRVVVVGDLIDAEAARSRLRHPSLALTVELDDPSVTADVDVDRLGQVLANIVDNAARATSGRGTVVIAVDSSGRGVDGVVRLTVTDDGPGVAASDHERIFDRLVRLDDGRERGSGAGLGLPIARGIARAHGGDVTCAPSGRGARFVVTLPAGVTAGGGVVGSVAGVSGRSGPR
ncbi:sensor histidine kinase [Microbacterium sp. P01]|uniref:sensor histidine kinase n=1 Tax=Microbacterium sp. P01 TaxID=3366261 RepID=UPI00366C7495